MTPQGQVATPPQPGWFSRNWKWMLAVGLFAPILCCGSVMVLGAFAGEPDAARVDCGTPGPGGVDCDVKRTGGSTAFKACWDLEITCANQAKMVGQACATLAAAETTGTANMPVEGFSNQDACDAPAAGTVTNLVVETVN